MPNTYAQIYIQIVFTVKGRENLIQESRREEIQKFISGIISNLNQKLYAIYCMPDHVHLLISIKPEIRISDLVRDIKANSSRFINEQGLSQRNFNGKKDIEVFHTVTRACKMLQATSSINLNIIKKDPSRTSTLSFLNSLK
jgi:putative transposase